MTPSHYINMTSSHYLIEPSEQYGAHHAGDVKPEPSQEPGTLQGDVRGPNDQGLPRGVLLGEDVIAGDAVLPGSRNIRVARATTLEGEGRGGEGRGEVNYK